MTIFGDSTTGRGFTWYTDKKATNSDVQIIKATSDANAKFENALTFKGKSQPSINADVFMVHKA